MARGEWEEAIARFRAMLSRDPTLLRVRLDLALAYFQAGEDGSSAYHFRQALAAEGLPAEARVRALAFLDRIRRRKSWSVTGSLSLAPDSNINAATSARQVDLFGLPATLSEDARQTSGVGFSAGIGGSYEARVAPDIRFVTSARLDTRTYGSGKSDFNERVLSLRAGPRFLFGRFDLRPELTARGRQLGGETYSRAGGFELSSDVLIAPTWRMSGSVGAEWISYESFLGEGVHLRCAGGSRACARAGDAAARGYGLSPRSAGQRRPLVARVHRRGVDRAGASAGVRGDGGSELQVARVWRAAPRLRPGCAAGRDGCGPDRGVEPAYRAVRVHAGAHAEARGAGEQPRSLRLRAQRGGAGKFVRSF